MSVLKVFEAMTLMAFVRFHLHSHHLVTDWHVDEAYRYTHR